METIIVTRGDAGLERNHQRNPDMNLFDAACYVALRKATTNFGMKDVKSITTGWKFIFEKVR